MSMEEKASDESLTADKLEAPVKMTVSADAYYKVDQYRHLRERQSSSQLFQQWLHGRGLGCDAKLIQKVVSNFFNRPWDGLVFANSKSVEDSESAAADRTGGDSVKQTRLPQVSRTPADAQPKGLDTQTSSHFTTAGPDAARRGLRVARPIWNESVRRTMTIFAAPMVPMKIDLDVPAIDGSILDEHFEVGMPEVDGIIANLKNFRLSQVGHTRVTISHAADRSGLVVTRGTLTKPLFSGWLTSHLLIKRLADDHCLVWLATADLLDAAAAENSLAVEALGVGKLVNMPVKPKMSLVDLTVNEVVIDALFCPGSSSVVLITQTQTASGEMLLGALSANANLHIGLVTLQGDPLQPAFPRYKWLMSLDMASAFTDAFLQDAPLPNLVLAGIRTAAGDWLIHIAASYKTTSLYSTQATWCLYRASHALGARSSVVSRAGSIQSDLGMGNEPTSFDRELSRTAEPQLRHPDKWSIAQSKVNPTEIIRAEQASQAPLARAAIGPKLEDLLAITELVTFHGKKDLYLLFTRWLVDDLRPALEVRERMEDADLSLDRVYRAIFLPAWATAFRRDIASHRTSVDCITSDQGSARMDNDHIHGMTPGRLNSYGEPDEGRHFMTYPPMALNVSESVGFDIIFNPDLLLAMGVNVDDIFSRLFLELVAYEEQGAELLRKLVALIRDRSVASSIPEIRQALAALALEITDLVGKDRLMERSKQNDFQALQITLFLHTVEMLMRSAGRLIC